jgi:predicted enzyme related to lactoylglutathione lyase
MTEAVQRSLAKGRMGGFGLRTEDCQKTYDELTSQGVDFTQPPSKRPYGVEAVMRDNSGNWLVLVEPSDYSPEDL